MTAASTGLRAVVLALPLAVSPSFFAPYDAPKAWWLQAIVLVTGLVWVLQRLQHEHGATASRPDHSLVVLRCLVAAYAGWWTLTTVMSVSPGQSLLGSFGRGFGLLIVLTAIGLFPLLQAECRTEQSRRSLIDAALLGSVAVCFLALGQALCWDRLPGTTDPASVSLRVRSTLGHHVLLGSYLTVLIPLTAARFVSVARPTPRVTYRAMGLAVAWVSGVLLLVWFASHRPALWPLLPLWGVAAAFAWNLGEGVVGDASHGRGLSLRFALGALLAMQVLVLTLSGSRGSALGAIAGLAVIIVFHWRRRTARVPIPVAGGLAGFVALGVLLGAVGSPLAGLCTIPVTGRATANEDARYTAEIRLRAWSALLGSLGRQAAGQDVTPGQSPLLRSVVGYGLDTQELVLDSLATRREGGAVRVARGEMRYVLDRAHNALLDHLVTGGLMGAGLWLAVLVFLVVVGRKRLRASEGEDWTLRLGCLGAVVGHLVEGCFGIETAVTSALFWMSAGMLTAPPVPDDGEVPSFTRQRRAPWLAGLIVLVGAGILAIAATTIWLLASAAFTRGIFDASAGRLDVARLELLGATGLVPGVIAPRSAAADVSLRMANREPDLPRRMAMLRESETVLAGARREAAVSGHSWLVKAKIALTRVLDGEADRLPMALAAFAMADHFRPNDADVLVPWSVALLEDGQPETAQTLARRVLSTSPNDWLAWAVVARAAARMGNQDEESQAVASARRHVPPGRAASLERFLRGRLVD